MEVLLPETSSEDTIAFDYGDPDNLLLLNLFGLCFDQIIVGPSGPIALDLKVLPLLFEAHGVTEAFDKKWLIEDLRSLSNGYLGLVAETSKKGRK